MVFDCYLFIWTYHFLLEIVLKTFAGFKQTIPRKRKLSVTCYASWERPPDDFGKLQITVLGRIAGPAREAKGKAPGELLPGSRVPRFQLRGIDAGLRLSASLPGISLLRETMQAGGASQSYLLFSKSSLGVKAALSTHLVAERGHNWRGCSGKSVVLFGKRSERTLTL